MKQKIHELPLACDFKEVFFKFGILESKKEKKMNPEVDIINIEEKAKKCNVYPYFMMDILSGDCLGVYTCANDETAIRSFCMSMDQMPQGIVHDSVLVKYDSREILFEGKNYLETWQAHQKLVMPYPHFANPQKKDN